MSNQYNNLPAELRQNGLFCLWRREDQKGRLTKVPYKTNSYRARSTDKADFVDFETAMRYVKNYNGIGLGIFDGFCAVDIDHCVKDGKLSYSANEIVNTFNSYTEFSPSGEGVRIIFKAQGVEYDKKRYYINNHKLGLEIYVSGCTSKYVTLTGNVIRNLPINDCATELKLVLEYYMKKGEDKKPECKTQDTTTYLSDDEVITKALNAKKRDGFNRMIADALDGKIELIVTKSVSRFARNTVDSLTTVRKLKDKGVEVYFEKENIWTMDSKGELLITIMSSLAQEESRSISENVTWGQRKRFADGKVNMPYKQFLGYRKGADGMPEIVESEAKIVRSIYRMFMEGMSTNAIAKHLTDAGIPTPSKKAKWLRQTVESILTNEKYKGSALLQKKYTVDFLQKKMKVNEGEVPQYYVEHSHPAIIEPEEWERV